MALRMTNPDGSVTTLYEPTIKQAEFHARTEPNVLFWGGRGSGKSVALRWEAHIRALSYPGFTYCILRRTYPELQKSHLMYISQEMKQLGGYFHHTDKMAIYPNGSKGVFSHCSNEEDVLNLLSAQFVWMGFDELSTFPWEMFTKLAASVRVSQTSGLTAMVRACTNPLGSSADELRAYFIDHDVDMTLEENRDYNPRDWYNIKANAEDNPHIDITQYRKRFSGLPQHVRKAWEDGEFILENALFSFHPETDDLDEDGKVRIDPRTEKVVKRPWHVLKRLNLEKLVHAGQVYRAYDHGYFPDPAYCLWLVHLGDRHIAIHEKFWYRHVAAEIAEDILTETARLEIPRVVITYCDPSIDINTGADVRTIKDTFEMKGVPMENSVNNREMFASSVHAALAETTPEGQPRLQIYGPGCPYLVKTLPQQRFNPKRPLALADHTHDHPTITLAYYLMSASSEARRAGPPATQVKPWMKDKNSGRLILGRESVRDW